MTMSKGQIGRRMLGFAVLATAMALGGAAWAAEYGQPAAWEFGLQKSVTPVMDNITWFHNFLVWLVTAITLFVLALLVIVVIKFNSKSNPVPSKTTHHTLIEVAWTIIPVLILVGIAVPSFRLLFLQLDLPKADLTVKATGKQWYWSYSYPDNGKFEFDSLLAQDKQPRLLAVDNEMVVPVNKVVRVQTTAADVIHAFAMPSFGVKIDAIPGRLNETWFKAEQARACLLRPVLRRSAARTTPSCRSLFASSAKQAYKSLASTEAAKKKYRERAGRCATQYAAAEAAAAFVSDATLGIPAAGPALIDLPINATGKRGSRTAETTES